MMQPEDQQNTNENLRPEPSLQPPPENEAQNVYPTPTKGPLAPSPSDDEPIGTGPEIIAPQRSSGGSNPAFGVVIRRFLASLVGIMVLSFMLGLIFQETLISHADEYFGTFADTYSILIPVAGVTVLFFIIGLLVHWPAYGLYPIVAFFLAAELSSSLPHYMAQLTPSDAHTTQSIAVAFTIMLAYTVIHAVVWPLRGIVKATGDIQGRRSPMPYFIVCGGVLIAGVSISLTTEPAYVSLVRAKAAVRMPSDKNYVYMTSPNKDGGELMYGAPTMQSDGTYTMTSSLKVEQYNNYLAKDAKLACKYPQYDKTPKGFRYGVWVKEEKRVVSQASNGHVKYAQFKTYTYCFVLDYKKYYIARTDRYGSEHMKKYPIGTVIDMVVKAKKYLPSCIKPGDSQGKIGYLGDAFCKASDKKQLEQLKSLRAAIPSNLVNHMYSQPVPGVHTPYVDPNAFQAVARYSVPEWGISFPLTEDMRDMYLDKRPSNFIIGFSSFGTGNACNARKGPGVNGLGVGVLRRTKLSDIKPQVTAYSEQYVEGVVVGNYVYGLSILGTLPGCLQSIGRPADFAGKLEDEFQWAQAGIKAQ